ncbi:thioredoxin family protein [Agromyces sp. SYSU T0242]|uniref:thioredoxin family protein n=1 Tax=Agromyces litoreus TaxID=3158561 RepID=UPI003394822C
MEFVPVLVVGLGLPATAAALGAVWRLRDGRVRRIAAHRSRRERTTEVTTLRDADALGRDADAFGADATLVQFSTEYCSRCPAASRALGALAAEYDGVRHLDVDLTHRPDLADAFRVTQTPTVLVLDADGRAIARVTGAPRVHELREVIDPITRRSRVPHPA